MNKWIYILMGIIVILECVLINFIQQDNLQAATQQSTKSNIVRVPIAISSGGGGITTICDDGTIWIWTGVVTNGEWRQLPDIPQTQGIKK